MGLDNGITVKRTAQTENISEMRLFEDDYVRKYKCDYEVCYWRKCWNIRNKILDVVYPWEPLSVEDIDKIIEVLKSFTTDNWEDEGSSIWCFDNMEETLRDQINNLGVLKRLMQEHELEVYFYDSY